MFIFPIKYRAFRNFVFFGSYNIHILHNGCTKNLNFHPPLLRVNMYTLCYDSFSRHKVLSSLNIKVVHIVQLTGYFNSLNFLQIYANQKTEQS